jgi:hypothetical protein
MRRLVLSILALIAIFSAIRAYTETRPVAGIDLHPGLIEVGDGSTSVGIAFGAMETTGGASRLWNILPLRIVYRSGSASVTIGLNGLSFLMRNGVTMGRPVSVDSPRTGDVISIGGKVRVDSRVDGDVWTLGADVELTPRAEITGNIVTLGGKVSSPQGAVVRGTVNQVPQLKIPFLGLMGTEVSAQIVGFGRQLLIYLLLAFALFLSCYYLPPHVRGLYRSLPATWRESLITLVVAVVALPIVTLLLIASVAGIFFLPILVFLLALASLDGFLMLCARLGSLLRRKEPSSAANESMFLLTSGLLGLFLVMLPALVGIALGVLRSGTAGKVGQVLQLVTLGCECAGLLYGLGASFSSVRARAAK